MTLRVMITGKLRSGKTVSSRYIEETYGAVRWHRAEMMKRLAHALIDRAGDMDELLERLFPEDEEVRDEIRHELLVYASKFVLDDGPKQHKLYQDVAEIVMQHDDLVFEQELLDRMKNAEAAMKKAKSDPDIVLVDDVRSLEAYEFWREHGFYSVRIESSTASRGARIRAVDGELPSSVLYHSSETALDDVDFDVVVKNDRTINELENSLSEAISTIRDKQKSTTEV